MSGRDQRMWLTVSNWTPNLTNASEASASGQVTASMQWVNCLQPTLREAEEIPTLLNGNARKATGKPQFLCLFYQMSHAKLLEQ